MGVGGLVVAVAGDLSVMECIVVVSGGSFRGGDVDAVSARWD